MGFTIVVTAVTIVIGPLTVWMGLLSNDKFIMGLGAFFFGVGLICGSIYEAVGFITARANGTEQAEKTKTTSAS
jgi:hypothetical protein